jgi:hypothetical protein
MLIEKLSEGVLCILTPLGPRYLRPSFWDRLHLLWIFRHFHRLPQQVLSSREQRFIEMLCQSDQFVSGLRRNGLEDAPVIGTLEHRVPVFIEEGSAHAATAAVRRSPGSPITDERGSS